MSDNKLAAGGVPYQQSVATPPSEQPPSGEGSGGGGPPDGTARLSASQRDATPLSAPHRNASPLLELVERLATNPNTSIDVIERLLNMRREEEDRAAKRAFNAALSQAKGEIEPILKKREVDFTSPKGRTKYKFEEFSDIARVIDPVFSRFGLAYRFAVAQDGAKVAVTCILSHADGYSESMPPLSGVVDAGGANMNPLQALGSALTYLQRYSLRAAIGLAAGRDDDARSLSMAPKVSAEQIMEMEQLIQETGSSGATLFRLIGVEDIPDMTVDQWRRAKEVLDLRMSERRRKNAPAGDA